jgi:hypothetical protein
MSVFKDAKKRQTPKRASRYGGSNPIALRFILRLRI